MESGSSRDSKRVSRSCMSRSCTYCSNEIETLDGSALCGLSALRVFVANGNGLRSLPDGFGSAGMLGDTLKSLSLSSNRLDTLPSSFAGLQSLRSLRLNGNRLREIPTELLALGSLQLLNLANNNIFKVSEGAAAQWLMAADGAQDDKAVAESRGKIPEVTMAGNPLLEEEEAKGTEADICLEEDDGDTEETENIGSRENCAEGIDGEGQGAAKRRRLES